MRIIVSGGGTGGHIYPAITIIGAIRKMVPDCEFLYVGTEAGLEADLVPKEKIPFRTVEIQGFRRQLTAENLMTLWKSAKSMLEAARIVRDFAPDAAIGTGGYVCGPILLAASLKGVPTLIQEQNVFPGITNKILSKFVTKVAVGYREASPHFPAGKVIFTGNPIREEVMTADRATGYAQFGLDAARRTVLISGGSRGARSINNAMIDVHRRFAGDPGMQLLHVTGKNEYADIVRRLAIQGIDPEKAGNIMVKPYLYNMPQALALADLAVFRAGAGALAELTAKGIPAILVPYPYAAENHQEHNARAMEARGAAVVIRDAELSPERLAELISAFCGDAARLEKMAAASRGMGMPGAAAHLAELAVGLANGNA